MTVTQIVDVPANRRVFIDVPSEIPVGKTQVVIQFPIRENEQSAAVPKKGNKKIGMTREQLDEFLKNAHTPISDSLLGILKTDMTLDEIRMARLARQL